MAAGSMIARDGRRRSRSTGCAASARRCRSRSAASSIGGLALSGVPPFSRLVLQGRRSSRSSTTAAAGTGCSWVARLRRRVPDRALHVPDDLPRVLRRAVRGGARAVEHGHLVHPSVPTNPANGEIEDTDVGFPGPEHAIAERELADEGRDGRCWRCWRSSAASSQIPGVDDLLDHFLAPTFADSKLIARRLRTTVLAIGLIIGAVIASAGIAHRLLRLGRAARARRRRSRARFAAPCTRCSINKWYFDELIDVARRAARRRGSAASRRPVFERRRRRRRADRRHDRARARRLGARARDPDRLPALLRRR